jgi:hypothetical protein
MAVRKLVQMLERALRVPTVCLVDYNVWQHFATSPQMAVIARGADANKSGMASLSRH